jgi:long-chain acyl-CoA synthetase
MKIKIENPDPETGEGEVLIKGPNVMKGYFKDPDKTSEVFTNDGWFRSGDLGILDEDDYLFLKGRSKNVIIGSNGKNIYPEELESIVNEQKFVSESLVIDRDGKLEVRIYLNYEQIDDEFGITKLNEADVRKIKEKILSDIFENSNARINKFSRLAKFVEQVEPFEKTPTQKIKRFLYV